MKKELSKKGAQIDAIYYCPHHPDENCDCRKPKTGLIEKAIDDFDIDTKRSFFIGDRMLEGEAGNNIGCKTVLIPKNKQKVEKERKESAVKPDHYCNDFYSGVKWILDI